ncbi:hypothetical protein [Pararhizobium sp. DWP3-4]|uniref:hypothetical protein n=1 Tax=Pararhizobium sp. DWP3-4 TaxID=2804565 RepID=UPI003CF80C9F
MISISDADSFFSSVEQHVKTLESSQRPNPLSIELLVGSTKRFLAKPEFRIQLDDLLSDETARLLSHLEGPEFEIPFDWDQAAFRIRVTRLESVSEGLATIAGIAGRWGEGREWSAVINTIRSVHAHGQKSRSGVSKFPNLRSYPAVLTFTSYALGLVRAGRWEMLHRLMSAELQNDYRRPTRLIETLFLWTWVGTENDAWKQLPDFEERKTPLSDHLLELTRSWSKTFVGAVPDFELLFERFEVLGSLVYLEGSSKNSLQETLAPEGQDNWAFMPVGRSGWNSRNASKLILELQSDNFRLPLLAAGFARMTRNSLICLLRIFSGQPVECAGNPPFSLGNTEATNLARINSATQNWYQESVEGSTGFDSLRSPLPGKLLSTYRNHGFWNPPHSSSSASERSV